MKCKIGNHDSIDEKTTTLPKDSPIEIETKESKKTLVNQ